MSKVIHVACIPVFRHDSQNKFMFKILFQKTHTLHSLAHYAFMIKKIKKLLKTILYKATRLIFPCKHNKEPLSSFIKTLVLFTISMYHYNNIGWFILFCQHNVYSLYLELQYLNVSWQHIVFHLCSKGTLLKAYINFISFVGYSFRSS